MLVYSFHGLLQIELDYVKKVWNNHTIRNSREAEYPGVKPDLFLYTLEVTEGKKNKRKK